MYSSSLFSLLRMTSNPTTESPLLVSRPLEGKVGEEIEIVADDSRVRGAAVKIGFLVNYHSQSHRLVLEHDILFIEKHEVNLAKTSLGKVGKDLAPMFSNRGATGKYGEIQVALLSLPSGGRRTEEAHSLNVRVLAENLGKNLQIRPPCSFSFFPQMFLLPAHPASCQSP
jgi:hypothetical protein